MVVRETSYSIQNREGCCSLSHVFRVSSRMPAERIRLYCAVFLVLVGTISCQYDSGTSSGTCAVTATSFGCANYRVLSRVSNELQPYYLRRNPDGSFTGFIWDLLNVLKATTDFNFTLSIQADGQYGALDAYGQWDGMIGQLVRNTTDVVIADLSFSSGRLSVIDFTIPYMPFHLVIVTQPNASLSYIKYAIKANSGTVTVLKAATDPRGRQIWANVQANMPTSLVQEADEGLALVRQGGWALIYPDAGVAVAVKNSYGSLVINKLPLYTNYYALGVQLGSPLRKPLTIALTKIMATGRLQQLLSKWDLAA